MDDPRFGRRRNLIDQNAVSSLLSLWRLAENDANDLGGSRRDPGKRRTHNQRIGSYERIVVALLAPGVGANLNGGFSGSLVGHRQACCLLSGR